MSDQPKKLFLLDAYALIYRAHFAFSRNPRISSKGVNTSVQFGFTNTLLEVLQKQKPTHIAIAFDTSAPTFRHKEYSEYKANRQETPEDIRTGIPIVKDIIRAFNIPILELDGYEADDIIGTFAKKAEKIGHTVYMMTPDKDFGQLVSENIFLYKPAYMGNSVDIMGVEEVCGKWNIENVDQVRDILGLHGDSSDNIPGIPGIGAKTASKLIAKYGTVEGLVEHVHELKGKQKENVENFGEQGLLSKQLATIDIEVPLDFDETELEYTGWDEEKLREILEDLEFRTISKRLFGESSSSGKKIPEGDGGQMSLFSGRSQSTTDSEESEEEVIENSDIKSKEVRYRLLQSDKEIAELAEFALKHKQVAIATVPDQDNVMEASILYLAINYYGDDSYIIKMGDQESSHAKLQLLNPIFENSSITLCGHDIKRDIVTLSRYGVHVKCKVFDTMLAHYLIEPDASHSLDLLAESELNYKMLTQGGLLLDQGMKKGKAQDLTNEHAQFLFGEMVVVIRQLSEHFMKVLDLQGLASLYYDVEIPLLKVLADMELTGVKVDPQTLGVLSSELEQLTQSLQKKIFEIADEEFNINSPKQLGDILFDKMQLVDKPKKTKSGQYATGEEILSKLSAEHEIARLILEYREYQKLKSTYVDALPTLINKDDGRIHTTFSQAVAATGRLSSINPNLQNIPIRTEMGRSIRKAFVPGEKDTLIVSADYSQIELRIMAHFSGDQDMIKAFQEGKDIHSITASKIFGIPLEEVDSDKRRMAKTANFGMIYGISAFGLSQNLNIPRSESAEIIDAYFTEFAAVKKYMDQAINQAREDGYVTTILGRKRYLRDINSRNATMRGYSERNAINAPIQGSAADMIKVAMIKVQNWLKEKDLKTKMVLQVHDELVFETPKDELDLILKEVPEMMKNAIKLDVPVEVEADKGKNWLEAH